MSTDHRTPFPAIKPVLCKGISRRRGSRSRKLFQSGMRNVADFLSEGNGYRSVWKILHEAALIKMIMVLSENANTMEWNNG